MQVKRSAAAFRRHAQPESRERAPQGQRDLTVFGAEHGLGGVAGYDAAETTDEDPERVTAIAGLSLAYLRTALYPGDSAWQAACDALTSSKDPFGRVESR